ncbi:caspase family protein [Limnohabitans sp. 15K]|uniref:caspase family protein n=1 Tax=Limnohabitans sp. 15K TaxID=1100706 RepID=UPI000C1EDFD9|nr:caspase family protein [Limnohabitans sp. 15K]PIT83531.1 hypothetical protein B9Z40_07830 [Limnohabitans sp. 15K]
MKALQNLPIRIKSAVSMLVLGGAFLSYSTNAEAPLDIRVALVIGNAAYKNVPALANSTNDAKSMSVVLRKLGFTVVEVVDGSKAQMSKAIEQLQLQLKGRQAVGMLYYAGHGLQLDWHNFMVPVDAKLEEASDVPKQTIDIENVIDVLKKSGTRMNIIVLDACRDNPFAEKASGKGLAQLDAPPGTYLAFATSPGNVAEDGDVSAGNGLFTQYLLKELQRPAKIEEVFKRVRLQVRQKSQGRQIPWDSSSLEEEFAFNDGKKFTFNPEDLIKEGQAAKEKEAKLKQEAEAAIQREKDIAAQQALEKLRLAEAQKIQETASRQKVEAEAKERERQLALAAEQERLKAQAAAQALERARAEEVQRLRDIEQAKLQVAEETRRSKLSQEAAREQQFVQEKADWDKIKDSKNVKEFYAFLLKYPNGLITEQASFAIEQLEKARVTTQADKNGQVQKLGEPRFRIGDKWTSVTRDNKTDRIVSKRDFKVDKIENGLAYFSTQNESGISTLDGAVLRAVNPEDTFTFDPPLIIMPGGEITVGMKWTASTLQSSLKRNETAIRTEEFRVVAYEQITVPAGTFWSYKIERNAIAFSGNKVTNTQWFSPDFGFSIKRLRKTVPAKRLGITVGNGLDEVTELVSISRGTSKNN